MFVQCSNKNFITFSDFKQAQKLTIFNIFSETKQRRQNCNTRHYPRGGDQKHHEFCRPSFWICHGLCDHHVSANKICFPNKVILSRTLI